MQKSQIFILSLIIAMSVVLGGCAYITGQAPGIPGTTIITPPRWVWGIADDSYPSTVFDRKTGTLVTDVSPEEALGIISSSSFSGNPVILDVRMPEEYAGGHIRDALNINYQSPSFKDKVARLDKNFTYIVYCRTGMRSSAARDIMEEMGFKHVINMTGGYADWLAAGLPVDH